MTKLIASMIVKDEGDRYLEACAWHLLDFCDEIRIVDDGSVIRVADSLPKAITAGGKVVILRNADSVFFEHEGRARQQLLDFTMEGGPSHVLAIDADEFVTDGSAIRRTIEGASNRVGVWTLEMQEVWGVSDGKLRIRADGGWVPHPVPILYGIPRTRHPRNWRIRDAALACGREPLAVSQVRGRATPSGSAVLHFGWACEVDRAARHQRYVDADGGRFHRSAHLDSIMLPDHLVKWREINFPESLYMWEEEITARANRTDIVRPAPPVFDNAEHAFHTVREDGAWLTIDWRGNVRHG